MIGISESPFSVPKIEKIGEFFVIDYIEGSPIEADEFPVSEIVYMQLGQYLKFTHSLNYNGFRNLINNLKDKSLFLGELVKVMRETIKSFWNDDINLHNILDLAIRDFNISNRFSLIMPDISANQFVYSPKNPQQILGIVDLDSYVIGPVEMELVVMEYVMLRDNNFLETYGYQTHMLDNSRMLFRLYMYLCDPGQEKSWDEFNSQPTFDS